MGRNLSDIIDNLPADRQMAIAAASQKKIADMLAHAAMRSDFLKAIRKTHAEGSPALEAHIPVDTPSAAKKRTRARAKVRGQS